MELNSKAFVPEEVKKGLHMDLIKYLLDYNQKSDKYIYDIHITTDGYCLIVEWCEKDYEGNFNDHFEYIDDEHVVMKECRFPDNSTRYLFDSEEQEELDEFLKDNPGWRKTEYGTWTNDIENERFRKSLKEDE